MQGGLIREWAGQDGFPTAHQCDGQPIKPIRPFAVKIPLDDELVDLKDLLGPLTKRTTLSLH